MFWKRTSDLSSNTIEVTIESAWRRDYSSTYFTAALGSNGESLMKINGKQSPKIDFGDNSSPKYLEAVRITAYSEQENWFLGEETFTHKFATPNNKGQPWEITFDGCCRMRNLLQGQDDKPWSMTALVDLIGADMSPRIVSLPVIHVRKVTTPNANTNSTFRLHTSELDSSITWSLGDNMPGQWVHEDGTVELDTKATGIPADCKAESCRVSVMAYAHFGNKLSIPVDLVVIMIPDPYPAFIDFPPRQTARLGFELKAEIKAFQNASAASGTYVGFTVGTLPKGLHLSTVRGKGINKDSDPAIMSLRWTPCADDLGTHVLCIDAVNNHGLAATQKCLVIEVVADDAPTLTITEVFGSGLVLSNASTTSDLMMGLEYTFKIASHDANGLDTLMLTAVPASMDDDCEGDKCIPDGASFGEVVHVHGPTGTTAERHLVFAPKHNHGGYKMMHCFAVSDNCGAACGDDNCPGRIDVVTMCVTVNVKRCEMVVRKGQQLQQIAAIYRSDWLQLWSHNQEMLHPDMDLNPHQVMNIGHLYDVQPFDKPADVAKRFGMDAASLKTLNANLDLDVMGEALCSSVVECTGVQMCILPNSCTGMSSSIYHNALEGMGSSWFAGARDGSPAP